MVQPMTTASAMTMLSTMPSTMPIIVSIEGNIGSGKSTLLTELHNKYGKDASICFIQEPVDAWNTVQDENGVSIL